MLLCGQAFLLLKLKITECTCKIEVTVYTSVGHLASSSLNACNFLFILRLVVKAQRDDIAAFSEDATRVTCVGDVKFLLIIVDHYDVCCTTDRVKL